MIIPFDSSPEPASGVVGPLIRLELPVLRVGWWGLNVHEPLPLRSLFSHHPPISVILSLVFESLVQSVM